MSGTGDKAEQLRGGEEEVEHLGHKEEQHRLREMAQDAHHCEGHPTPIAECISHKSSRRVPKQEENKTSVTKGGWRYSGGKGRVEIFGGKGRAEIFRWQREGGDIRWQR